MTPGPESQDVVQLAARMMEIDSTSGQEGAVVDWLARYLEAAAWNVRRIPVTPGRDNLLATTERPPVVTLSTHVDTVPPYIPPRLEGNVLWGRGACDAKGIVASMIAAAERLRDAGVPVALLFVVGEEVSHDGAIAANRVVTTSKVLIDGEPTDNTLAVASKGALRFTLRVDGVAAHSAYPERGRSAIDALVELLSELDAVSLPTDPVMGATTINIGLISGGVADNVIAPSAEARLMARLVTPAESLLALLRDWVHDRATLEPGICVPAVTLGTVSGFPTSVAAFATDIPELTNWGTPYLFGPGSIHVAHGNQEHVRVADLHAAIDGYVQIATKALEAASFRA